MFDIDQATKDAVRTDLSPEQYKDAVQRLQWCSDLPNLMQRLIAIGHSLDLIKKYVFYGKVSTGLKLNTSIVVHNASELIRLLHGVMGLATETGELAEALASPMSRGDPVDEVNVGEECGDVSWYLRLLADELKEPLSGIIQTNVAKLKARYPDKFTEERAINRDLGAERIVLESKPCTDCGGTGEIGSGGGFNRSCRACDGTGRVPAPRSTITGLIDGEYPEKGL